MGFGSFSDNRHAGPMADINVTPMVDVMLVLLVIFILAAPLFTHALKLDLPGAPAPAAPHTPATVVIAIDAAGALYWDKAPIARTELDARFAQLAQSTPQADLQLRADKKTAFEAVTDVMAAAQSHGLSHIGFVTDPKPQARK